MLVKRLAVIPALLLFVLGFALEGRAGPGPVESSDTPWEIVADAITYEKQPPSVVASGEVVIQQQSVSEPLVIRADWVRYEPDQHRAEARGRVMITSGIDEIRAESAFIQLDSRTGTFEQATLLRAENHLHLSGYTIEKTGERTYHLKSSRLTTCPVAPAPAPAPPWSIASADARITTGGYAHLRHATFRIRDYPVFYLPYLIVPAIQERKTGLLFPQFSQSEREGTGILAPLFINLSPSRDLTLYPGWLSRRGPQAGLEFRYIVDPRSRGIFAANFLRDSTADVPGDDYKSDGLLRTEHDRYWLRGKLDQEFGGNLVARLDLDLVSDRDFLQEFQQGLIGFQEGNKDFLAQYHRGLQAETIPTRENTMQLTRRSTSSELAGELLAVDDASEQPGTEKPLWSLPRLLFSGATPLPRFPADLTWESEYINYWRADGLIAHRLDLHPQLLAALPTGPYLESSVAAGPRETLYLAAVNGPQTPAGWDRGEDSALRSLYDLDARVATTFVRNFDLAEGGFLRHTVRPEIGYAYTPDVDQSELPELDMQDRVAPKDWLTYGLNNYFFRQTQQDETEAGRNLGYLKITQAYDRRQDLHPLSDLAFDANLTPVERLALRYETTVSIYGQGVTHYYLRGSLSGRRPGDRMSLSYRYLQHSGLTEPFFYAELPTPSVHALGAALAKGLTDKLSASCDVNHSFSTNKMVSSSLRLLYHPACWSVEMVASKLPDDFSLFLVFSLEGIGKALEMGVPGVGR